jgi:mannose-6-phosphate isomerase-like protein (cupin superfamily)
VAAGVWVSHSTNCCCPAVKAEPSCKTACLAAVPTSAGEAAARCSISRFSELWKPKVGGELNGQQVKLVKLLGPFVRHHHDEEDELFLVVKGRFRMEFRDRHVWLGEGEFLVVPRGVEHRPVAELEAHVLLFEPASTLNTGNVRNERTVADLERI